ncbi:MAG: MBL fold metallo-hydrolase [Clostridia bacterium]|nr:MBL fold metallo-hydrolase [Clostridia bacterium]
MTRKKKILLIISTVLLVVTAALSVALVIHLTKHGTDERPPVGITPVESRDLVVYFLDAGQADCTLLMCPEGCVLVDTGLYEDRFRTLAYLNSLGVKTIDWLVVTHAHSDHYGGADSVMEAYRVDNFLLGGGISTAYGYEKMLETAERKKINTVEPFAGYRFTVGEMICEVLGPLRDYGDENMNSTVLKITYGQNVILLMADTGFEAEAELVARYGEKIRADILKLGHHGSAYSTSSYFLKAVHPRYAVASCGKNNDYSHPAPSTRSRLLELTVPLIITHENSPAVIFECTGEEVIRR